MMLSDKGKCFACGKENPIGLKLDFQEKGDLFFSEFTPREEHQGYAGITHGGIVTTLLDEVMANHLLAQGIAVVTGEIMVRFINPVPVGEKLVVGSKLVDRRKRILEMESWVQNTQGTILAKGRAKMIRVSEQGLSETGF